jgi:hypothetical protein
MDVRNFTLTNNNGISYDLQTKKRFLINPSGLGYEESTTYQNFGAHYAPLDEGLAQGVIDASIVFVGASRSEIYNKFYEFAKFARCNPLVMQYTPIFDTFFRQCRISKLNKTEISNGALQIDVQIACITPWYKTKSDYNSGVAGGGKQYALQESGLYGYNYDYTYSDNIIQSVTIDNDGFEESPCKFVIYGYAVNPTWNHYVNGELFATGKADITVAANHKLVIDTTTIPYTMRELDMTNNLIRDCYQLSDFSTERFIRLQPGKNRISLSHSGSNIVTVAVDAQIEFAAV